MGITVQWGDEARTHLVYRFEGSWNWTELYTSLSEGNVLMNEIDHRANAIIDVSNSHMVPSGVITHVRGMGKRTHPNTDLTILVGANRLVQSLYDLMQKIRPTSESKFVIVHTLEEAYAILEKSKIG